MWGVVSICSSGPNGKKSHLKIGIPTVWRKPTHHDTDCNFCAIDVTGINRKYSFKCFDLESEGCPVGHCDETQRMCLHVIEGVSTIVLNQ